MSRVCEGSVKSTRVTQIFRPWVFPMGPFFTNTFKDVDRGREDNWLFICTSQGDTRSNENPSQLSQVAPKQQQPTVTDRVMVSQKRASKEHIGKVLLRTN